MGISNHRRKQYVCEHSNGNVKGAAAMLGVSYETFRTWHDGKKSPTIINISLYMSELGFELPPSPNTPTIRRLGSTGAGEPTALFSGEPEMFLQILPQYMRPGMGAFMVDGDSM